MKTIVVLTDAGLAPEAVSLAQDNGFKVQMVNSFLTDAELEAQLKQHRPIALVARLGKVTQRVIQASSELRLIVKHGTGYEDIDVGAATASGIPVLITRGSNSQSVAEHALGLMFAVAQRITSLDGRIRDGHWDRMQYDGFELTGKSLGIVGCGSIGRALIGIVRPLQMVIRVFDPHMQPSEINEDVQKLASLEDLLRISDIVSVNCPLTPHTQNMISARELSLMKNTAILINTARGGIVDEAALADAVASRRLAGAGLDAFKAEPLPVDSPLIRVPKIVLSPHVGGNSVEAKLRTGLMAIRHVIDYFHTGTLAAADLINPGVHVSPSILRSDAHAAL